MVRAARARLAVSGTVMVALLVLASAGCARERSSEPPQSAPIHLAPCSVPGLQRPARCGTHEVSENREAQAGRRIALNIIVVPATDSDRQPDPVFYFDGGPGAGATTSAARISGLLQSVNRTRDLVFVDLRGTGRSHPLTCEIPADDAPLQRHLAEFLSDDYVRDCLARQDADVRFYTQPIAIDDIDEVRAGLGYEHINLVGASAGTRQAQLYMRRHPASVRAVVLHGVQPMDAEMPLSFSRALDDGLRALIEACRADEACNEAYPSLAADWEVVRRRFESGPVEADARHPRTGRRERVVISRGVFADGLRHLLYDIEGAWQVPGVIASASRGNFDEFASREVAQSIGFSRLLAHGMFISSTCAEDVRFIDEEDVRQATEGTFLGDYRVRRQQAACRIWPRGVGVDDGFEAPVRLDVPVLIISGDVDVATPASDGERVAKALPNALHVVFPGQGHGFTNPACAAQLITSAIESARVQGLDTRCAAETRRPPFRR